MRSIISEIDWVYQSSSNQNRKNTGYSSKDGSATWDLSYVLTFPKISLTTMNFVHVQLNFLLVYIKEQIENLQ